MTDIILNSESSIILAQGSAPSFFRSWRFLGILILSILFGLSLIFWLALSRPLPVPRGTFFIGVISPHAAKQYFSPNLLNAMPEIWKRTLSSDSSWPVAYGLSNDDDHVRAFILGPRWLIPDGPDRQTAGLSAYLPENGLVTENDRISYAATMSWRGWRKQPAFRWLQGQDTLFRWDGQRFISDASWRLADIPNPSDADLSLGLGDESREEIAAPQIALAAGLADLPKLRTLPPATRYELWVDGEAMRFDKRRLTFATTLNEEQAASILGAFSVTQRRVITLPDGSTSIERIQPIATTNTTLFGERPNDRNEWLRLTPSELQINASGTNWTINPAPACAVTSSWIRLSGKAVNMMLDDLGWNLANVTLTGLQIGSYNGKLAICLE